MRLSKLTLAGFKSFADKTEILFDRQIVGIVGPNGCGKSNVVDAIKWVLGEQSAKSLRGGAMQDVIFNGSSARRPSGMAFVTLTFENPIIEELSLAKNKIPRRLPLDNDFVEITRQLFRDGTSDYMMNGRRVRLKDIKEVFLDTGVGTDAYSVIEQGKVARMLETNPKERRAIFEEAAGISRFKQRKKEAERKLAKTEQNLVLSKQRLEDTEKRLRSIKMQAARARSWKEQHKQLRELQLGMFLLQYQQTKMELDSLQIELDKANIASFNAQTQIAEQDSNLQRIEQVYKEELNLLTECRAQLHQVKSELQQHQQRVVFLERTYEETLGRIAQDKEQLAEIDRQFSDLARQKTETQTLLEQCTTNRKNAEKLLESARQQLQDSQLHAQTLKEQLKELENTERLTDRDIQSARAKKRSQLQYIERLEQNRATFQERITQQNAEAASFEEQIKALQAEKDRYQVDLDATDIELQKVMAEIENAHGYQIKTNEDLTNLRGELSGVQSRAQLLNELEISRKGANDAQDTWQALPDINGLPRCEGLLAELIEVDLKYAQAVETALGDLATAIVIDNQSFLQAETQHEISELQGRLTFIIAQQQACEIPVWPHADVPIEHIHTWVQIAPKYQNLLVRLLGHSVVLKHPMSPLNIQKLLENSSSNWRIITPEGIHYHSHGTVKAGLLAPIGEGLVSRKSELNSLKKTTESYELSIKEKHSELSRADIALAKLEEQQESYKSTISYLERQMLQANGKQESFADQLERLTTQRPKLSGELQELDQQVIDSKNEIASLEVFIQQQEEKLTTIQEQLPAITAEYAIQDDVLAATQEQVMQLRLEASQLSQQHLEYERSLRQINVNHANCERSQQRLIEHIEQAEAKLAEMTDGVEESHTEIIMLKASLENFEIQCEEVEHALESHQEVVKTLKEKLKTARQIANQNEKHAHGLEVRESQCLSQLETIKIRSSEQLEVDIKATYIRYCQIPIIHRQATLRSVPLQSAAEAGATLFQMTVDAQVIELNWDIQQGSLLDFEISEREQLIDEYKGRLHRLGNVNLGAIQEEEELTTAEESLAKQVTDIEQASYQLTELIDQINRDSRVRFEKVFTEIKENFASQDGMFRRIFGGGKADLVMQADENGDIDVLEAGIDIMAKPPGKEPRALSQLSGGEKTMTALALLMAIFKSKPSPYCILDEVDAALDEANVDRYIKVLQSFLSKSHFIVITHRKPTMQGCDVLYGITMQERGVSKRVRVNIDQIDTDGDMVLTKADHVTN